MRGVLITVEGVEGSGKSTQCARLARYLSNRWPEVAKTSEPDGTALGVRIRALFEDGSAPTPLTQTFLFMAARQEHVTRVIAPALARGAVVISALLPSAATSTRSIFTAARSSSGEPYAPVYSYR